MTLSIIPVASYLVRSMESSRVIVSAINPRFNEGEDATAELMHPVIIVSSPDLQFSK